MSTKRQNSDPFHNLGSIALSVLLAIFVAKTGIVKGILLQNGEAEVIGSFLSGMFFTSIFTTAPAMVMLYEIAEGWAALPVALIGAFGAVVGDLLIFRFIRDRLTAGVNRKWIKILHLSKARFLAAIFGAIIIASPLPDELGLALMGMSNVKQRWIIPMSFVFNFLGILAILPSLANSATGMSTLLVGGTGVLIVVSVVLETVKALEAQLVMRNYEGFLKE